MLDVTILVELAPPSTPGGMNKGSRLGCFGVKVARCCFSHSDPWVLAS